MSEKHPYSDGVTTISPWYPESDPVRVAALGKLIEELTEAASRAARCVIQGLEEADPETGRSNHEELGREMADIQAAFLALQLEVGTIPVTETRVSNKYNGFRRWFNLIRKP